MGPKLALAILSAMSVEQFAYAIEREELSKLTKIPGVGKKTAERLLVELKGKFKGVKQSDFFVESTHIPSEAEKMVKRVAKPDLTSEQVIREALKAAL